MSVSVKKNGVFLSGGNGIGKNLVWNGNAINGNSKWGNWATATNRTVEYINGRYWFHHVSDSTGTKYGGFYQNNANTDQSGSGFKPNTYYTISALWFASEEVNCRYWLHMRSTDGGNNIIQYTKDITVTPTIQRFYYTFNSGSNNTYEINRFNLMIGTSGATVAADVYFTDVKMEEGQIATPYIPNENDEIYLSDNSCFNEVDLLKQASLGTDYVVGNCFYEY